MGRVIYPWCHPISAARSGVSGRRGGAAFRAPSASWAVITAPIPSRPTIGDLPILGWRLPGPFGFRASAGFHLTRLSEAPLGSVLLLFSAFRSSVVRRSIGSAGRNCQAPDSPPEAVSEHQADPTPSFPQMRKGEICSFLLHSVGFVAGSVGGPAQFCNVGVGNSGHICHAAWQKRTGGGGGRTGRPAVSLRCHRAPTRDAGHPQGMPLRSYPVGGRISGPRGCPSRKRG